MPDFVTNLIGSTLSISLVYRVRRGPSGSDTDTTSDINNYHREGWIYKKRTPLFRNIRAIHMREFTCVLKFFVKEKGGVVIRTLYKRYFNALKKRW